MTKRCRNCKGRFDSSKFGVHSSRPDGLADNCKPCARALTRKRRMRRSAEAHITGKAFDRDTPLADPRTPIVSPEGVPYPKVGVIGDTQLGDNVPADHLIWIARYFAEKDVETVVQLGDWADMASLSSYESRAKKAVDKRSVRQDFDSANDGWNTLEGEWQRLGWQPKRRVYLLGNHEQRIERYVADNPEMAGDINYRRFAAFDWGWEVYDFLVPVEIHGVVYSHYFPRSSNGHVFQATRGAPSALAQVKREMRSCTAGHTPGLDVAIMPAGGRLLRGLILGSSYLHSERFMTPQGNHYWRGVYLKHRCHDGWYDGVEVHLDFLRQRYGD